MNTILPESAVVNKKQIEWLKTLCEDASKLASFTAMPLPEAVAVERPREKGDRTERPERLPVASTPGLPTQALGRLRDELRAFLIDVTKCNPWQ